MICPSPGLEVWRIDLREADRAPRQAFHLDLAERARAQQLLDGHASLRWQWAHSAMRVILAEHLVVAPAELTYAQGEGKPRLEPGARVPADLEFNLTHSGDWAWLALARDSRVGIDLEKVALERAWPAMVAEVCTPREARFLVGCGEQERTWQFHRIWVRKEALLKAAGTGLGSDQPLWATDTLEPFTRFGPAGAPTAWWVSDVPAPAGYVGAIATSVPGLKIVWRDFHSGLEPA